MKILYITRSDSSKIFGGDEVQYRKTKEFLEKMYNISVDIKGIQEDFKNNIEEYDIIHFWGILTAEPDLLKYLKKRNKKIVISSIFWEFTDSILINYTYNICYMLSNNILKIFQNIIVWVTANILYNIIPKFAKRKNSLYLHKNSIKYKNDIILLANKIIPNSDEEGEILCKRSDVKFFEKENKFISIPNSVDIDYTKKHKDTGFMSDVKDFVIEAAGIEPLKNQLGILYALYNRPDIPIIFAGGIRDNRYYKKLKDIAEKRGNVYFTGKIPPDDLFSLYKRAKVHVLASFRESPGLATLEALMCGSQIVVSEEKFCPIKYYQFDKYGFVCNPYDVKSIRNAVLEAYNHPKDISLPEEYIKFFSYENVAKMTYEVYERVINEIYINNCTCL